MEEESALVCLGMTMTPQMEQVCFCLKYNIFLRFCERSFIFSSLLKGVRDYIHVVDLAKGHIAALKKLKDDCGCKVRIN